jgi:hypothetical protein
MTRLLVSLSPHGYGHAAMTAPLIEALRAVRPDLELILQTSTAPGWLKSRYAEPFQLIDQTPDFGMVMESALKVLPEESHRRYLDLHARLETVVEAEAALYARLKPDLLLSNISYIALLAARRAGIPAAAMSCLNWAEIYGAYCGHLPGAGAVVAQMNQAYECAAFFLCPAPSLPMSVLSNIRPIGPLARRAVKRRPALLQALGAGEQEKIGLIGFGGMDAPLDYARWPRLPGWHWVLGNGTVSGREDMRLLADIPMSFSDLLASSDVCIGKPGYGTFTEAAVNGTPMLYLPRPDWPESPNLHKWLNDYGRALPVALEEMFQSEALKNQLRTLFSMEIKPQAQPTGIEEGVAALLPLLPPPQNMRM